MSLALVSSLTDGIHNKLADVIVEWNVNKVYSNFSLTGKAENEGNCQDFVEAVLRALGIKLMFDGAFGMLVVVIS